MPESQGGGFLPSLRGKIRESIYGQPRDNKNIASRWVIDKLSSKEQVKQEEALVRLETITQRVDRIWGDQSIRNGKLSRDDYEWSHHGHRGNYQKAEFEYRGEKQGVNFASWYGVINNDRFWGELNQVNGYIGSGELNGRHYSEAAYYQIDTAKPLIGYNNIRRMSTVRLGGDQLLPEALLGKGIQDVIVSSEGLVVHHNQFDDALEFKDRTHATVSYTSGTVEHDKVYGRDTGISPDGPIHKVRLLISSYQPTWSKGAQTIEGNMDWLEMNKGEDGKWQVSEMADKWARRMVVNGETLPNGDVKISLKVGDDTKEMVLPRIDLEAVLKASEGLVDAIEKNLLPSK